MKGRDPDWTCIIDGQRIGGDIYIHQADTILGVSMGTAVFALFGALIAVLLVVLWQTWVIIRLKPAAVERAVKLSHEKYCSASIMMAKTAEAAVASS